MARKASATLLLFLLLKATALASTASSNAPGPEACTRHGNALLQLHKSTYLADPNAEDAEGNTSASMNNMECRGDSATDNQSDSYFVYNGTPSLEACKEKCIRVPFCKGIQYNPDLEAGRCETWIRTIRAVSPRTGSACLRLIPDFHRMPQTNGSEEGYLDQACRGSSPNDDSRSYYDLRLGIKSLAECKDLCVRADVCKGVEYNETGGRCEVWTRSAGIGGTINRTGFLCFKYTPTFAPAEATSTPWPQRTTTATTTWTTSTSSMAIPSPLSIIRTTEHAFADTDARDVNIVNLTATRALLCSLSRFNSHCMLLDVQGSNVTQGSSFSVEDEGDCSRLSVDRLTDTTALACYVTHQPGSFRPKPMCRVLALMGSMVVAKGEAAQVDWGDEVIFSMTTVGLSPAAGIICYDHLEDEVLKGICRVVTISANKVYPGGSADIGQGDVEFGPDPVVARLSHDRALVCYRGEYEKATCNILTLAGIALLKGEKFEISDGHFHSLAAVGLSSTAAMVCLKDFTTKPAHSACYMLAANLTSLALVDSARIFTGRTSVARLSNSAALACSCDGHHQMMTKCTTLALVGPTLVKGDDREMTASGRGNYYSAVGLSSTSALLCFEDQRLLNSKRGFCTLLEMSWVHGASREL